jgi:hypothetical protein
MRRTARLSVSFTRGARFQSHPCVFLRILGDLNRNEQGGRFNLATPPSQRQGLDYRLLTLTQAI